MKVTVLFYAASKSIDKIFASKGDAERYVEFCKKREADYDEAFNRYIDYGGDCPEFERDWPASLNFKMVEFEVEEFKTV